MKRCAALLLTSWTLLSGCQNDGVEQEQSVLFIEGVTLIDGTGAPPQVNVDLHIQEGRIENVGTNLPIPDGASTIDGNGLYAIPGLIDTHVHLEAPVLYQLNDEEREAVVKYNPSAFLFNGVTTVLDLSSDPDWIWTRRALQRTGEILSPRIFAMGSSFSPQGGWGYGDGLADAADARSKALEYVSHRTDGFKVVLEDGLGATGTFREMPEQMLNAIVEVAEEQGIPVYVHAINLSEYRRAARINPRAIVHGLEDPIPDGDPILHDLAENGIAVIPTLSLFESFLTMDGSFQDPILQSSVPTFLLEKLQQPGFLASEREVFLEYARMDAYAWVEDKLPIFKQNVTAMHEAGVKLAVGTDAGGQVGFNFQGYNTPWELQLLVACGLNPMEALQAATLNAAQVIGVSDQLGTLEPGKWADLLLLDANPLENIRNVRRIHRVVVGGEVYEREQFAYPEDRRP